MGCGYINGYIVRVRLHKLTNRVSSTKLPLLNVIEVRMDTQFELQQIHFHFTMLQVQT